MKWLIVCHRPSVGLPLFGGVCLRCSYAVLFLLYLQLRAVFEAPLHDIRLLARSLDEFGLGDGGPAGEDAVSVGGVGRRDAVGRLTTWRSPGA